MDDADDADTPESVPLAITGELDLHTFRPQDIGSLLPAWLAECHAHGFRQVRVVHGKGSGALRKGVEAVLRRSPGVLAFQTAPPERGGWGATLVELTGGPWPA